MDELVGPNLQIKLSIKEGKNLEVLQNLTSLFNNGCFNCHNIFALNC